MKYIKLYKSEINIQKIEEKRQKLIYNLLPIRPRPIPISIDDPIILATEQPIRPIPW